MRPTRLGAKAILFYGLLVFSFYAAPYLNLFFLLLAFSSVLGLLGMWWTLQNVRGLAGTVSGIAPMPAGASWLAMATLSCERRNRYDLRLSVTIAGENRTLAQGIELRPGDSNVEVMMPALPRGVHAMRSARVSSSFPFGFANSSRVIESQEELIVYPAPADLSAYRSRKAGGAPGSGGLGGHSTEEMGPAGLREFRDGDEMRNVHWKASARRNGLVVKEFEGDASPGMEILLDMRCDAERLEESLSLIAALLAECAEKKELLTLYTQDHHGTYGEGHEPNETLYCYLAAVTKLADDAAPPPAASPSVLRLPLASQASPAEVMA